MYLRHQRGCRDPQQYESGALRSDLTALLRAWTRLSSGRPYGHGPVYHRLLHGPAPLDDQFVDDIVDMALRGIQPGVAARGAAL